MVQLKVSNMFLFLHFSLSNVHFITLFRAQNNCLQGMKISDNMKNMSLIPDDQLSLFSNVLLLIMLMKHQETTTSIRTPMDFIDHDHIS